LSISDLKMLPGGCSQMRTYGFVVSVLGLAAWTAMGATALAQEAKADAPPAKAVEQPATNAPGGPSEKTAVEARPEAVEVVSRPITLVLKADLETQRLTVIEGDTVIAVWPISSGRAGYATPTGTFQPQWAAKRWYSRQYYYAAMPHAVFFTRGVAFHGTTAVGLLGRPASHGCVRLAGPNAERLFNLVHKHGLAQTSVIVQGAPKPSPPRYEAPVVARRQPAAASRIREAREKSRRLNTNGTPTWAAALFNR
jgi:lipoprotein-anchoring transpeptidase ErfK/SrfK